MINRSAHRAIKSFLISLAKTGISKVNFTWTTRVNGRRIKIPVLQGMTCRENEPWMLAILQRLLPIAPGAFLDVGVNVGQTLVKVKGIDESRRYIGFEPNPACVYYVQQLIKQNNFSNCILLPIGLHTEAAVLFLDLFSVSATDSSASLVKNYRPNNRIFNSIPVPTFPFDDLIDLLPKEKVGVIKIDVEGAELEVSQSMRTTIERDRPTVLMEILPAYSEDNVARIRSNQGVWEIFRAAGYSIYRVEKTTTNGFGNLKQIDNIAIHSDLDMCDYVLIPNERPDCVSAIQRPS